MGSVLNDLLRSISSGVGEDEISSGNEGSGAESTGGHLGMWGITVHELGIKSLYCTGNVQTWPDHVGGGTKTVGSGIGSGTAG